MWMVDGGSLPVTVDNMADKAKRVKGSFTKDYAEEAFTSFQL